MIGALLASACLQVCCKYFQCCLYGECGGRFGVAKWIFVAFLWFQGGRAVYFGEYSTSLDEKGRIIMPRRFRETMNVLGHAVWYMTRGFDRSIFLFHHEEWQKIRAQAAKYSSMNAKALDFRRMFFGSVAEAKPDAQGRMHIPTHLREFAGLEKEAVLLGVDDHLEIWSKEHWRAFQEQNEAAYKDMATQLFMGQEERVAATAEGGIENENRAE